MELRESAARDAARAETEQLRLALPTSIRGALGTLRGAGEAPAVREDLLTATKEETVRLTRTIASILDIVRLENGQAEPRKEPADLVEAGGAAAGRRVVTQCQLLTALRGPAHTENAQDLRVYIGHLRQQSGTAAGLLRTEPGVGYRLAEEG